MRAIHNLSRAVYAILALGLGALNAYAFDFENPIKANDFGTVVQAIAGLMLKIGIPVATIFLLYAGFLFVTARGDETKLKTAKEVFWYTVIGTAIIVGASVIASAVVNFAKNLS
ncbi:MAG: TrbC/VirB2 family protein [bacterium]|nr:TrbC/VirB2 family protein [bacterium]